MLPPLSKSWKKGGRQRLKCSALSVRRRPLAGRHQLACQLCQRPGHVAVRPMAEERFVLLEGAHEQVGCRRDFGQGRVGHRCLDGIRCQNAIAEVFSCVNWRKVGKYAVAVPAEDEAALLARAREVACAENVYLVMGLATEYQDERPYEQKVLVVAPNGEVILEHFKYAGSAIETGRFVGE